MKFRDIALFVVVTACLVGGCAVAYGQEAQTAQAASTVSSPAPTTIVPDVSKRLDAIEKLIQSVQTSVQQAQSPDAQRAKLVTSYRSYFESARKSTDYLACKAAGGTPVSKIENGSGSVVCWGR